MRRLVADACAPGVTGVFARDGSGLVAHLTGSPAGPAAAHGRCLAALPGRVGALAPHRYVVCAGAPDDPGDEAAWRRLPVLTEDSGR